MRGGRGVICPAPYTLTTPSTLQPTPCSTPHSKALARSQEQIKVVIPKLQQKIIEKQRAVKEDRKSANPSTLYPLPSEPSFAMSSTTRWSTTLSSKVNLPHIFNFRALCCANLAT